jgi:hypothetical protein
MNGPLSDFDFLASWGGEPGQFWSRWSCFAMERFAAEGVCLLLQAGQGVNSVRVVAQDRPASAHSVVKHGIIADLESLCGNGLHAWSLDVLILSMKGAEVSSPQLWLVVLGARVPDAEAVARELRLLAETYQGKRRESRHAEQLLTLQEVLDLGLVMGECDTFAKGALRLCHRVSSVFSASRVSLGWREGANLQLSATSHGGRVVRDLQETEALLRAMEESADQHNEVSWPEISGSQTISREHQAFSRAHGDTAVLSAPLYDASKHSAGVLLLEREALGGAWSALDLERLRLAADLVASRLQDLHRHSGWWGRRCWRSCRDFSARLLGVEHTGLKLSVLVLILTLLVLAFIPTDHKVSSPFLLKSDATMLSTAPFDGYIDEVRYHLGDVVKQGAVLVTLDRRELLLEEADGMASRERSDREARSYEAENKLAEALMAKAQVRQIDARLAMVRHRLAKTAVLAPFDGVVVEGDLRERLSSPVHIGEPLVKMVQLKDLTGQLQVDERDIGYLSQGLMGEVVFASRPSERFKVRVDHFEPVAEVRQEGNVFVLRVQITDPPQDWWRPGMSGICKIVVGKRSLLWVLTHRTVETLRLWFWW